MTPDPAAGRVEIELQSRSFATTAVSRLELLAGARDKTAEGLVRRLLDSMSTLPLDRESADRAVAVPRVLELRGSSIGMADSLIAGVVMTHDALLLTRSRKPLRAGRGAEAGRPVVASSAHGPTGCASLRRLRRPTPRARSPSHAEIDRDCDRRENVG